MPVQKARSRAINALRKIPSKKKKEKNAVYTKVLVGGAEVEGAEDTSSGSGVTRHSRVQLHILRRVRRNCIKTRREYATARRGEMLRRVSTPVGRCARGGEEDGWEGGGG